MGRFFITLLVAFGIGGTVYLSLVHRHAEVSGVVESVEYHNGSLSEFGKAIVRFNDGRTVIFPCRGDSAVEIRCGVTNTFHLVNGKLQWVEMGPEPKAVQPEVSAVLIDPLDMAQSETCIIDVSKTGKPFAYAADLVYRPNCEQPDVWCNKHKCYHKHEEVFAQ